MDTFTIDCDKVSSETEFWRTYLAVVKPDGAVFFGSNLAAFRDAITGGGPGWPGECHLQFTNTESLMRINAGTFFQGLLSVAADASLVRITFE